MAKINYKKFDTVLGDNWHAVVDGLWLFYPCGEDLDEVKAFVETHKEAVINKRNSSENYGLAYHICGYNEDAQQRLVDEWAKRGVRIF